VDGVATLDTFPERGRGGRVAETRELVFPSLPFIAVYEVDSEVTVLRILHAARLWPTKTI
jgi:toxin ParE1/3/4